MCRQVGKGENITKESGEDYLENILILQNRNGIVHSIDIAAENEFVESKRQCCHEKT